MRGIIVDTQDITKSIQELQVALHELLQIFLSCSRICLLSIFCQPNYVHFRLNGLIKELIALTNCFGSASRAFREVLLEVQDKSRAYPSRNLAEIIVKGYQLLEQYINTFETRSTYITFTNMKNSFWWQEINRRKTLEPVRNFANILRDKGKDYGILGAWIHGSIGTLDDIPGYSDFDALVLLSDDVCYNAKKLLEAQTFLTKLSTQFYLYDPLQHHGIFVLTLTDLKAYPEAFFPVELFRYASPCLVKESNLSIVYVRDDFIERKQIFVGAVRTLRKFGLKENRSLFGYDIKAFIQTLVLLPAFYLQLKNGVYYYKKFTFDLARKDFPESIWSILDKATKLRSNWKYITPLPRFLRQFLGESINPRLLSTAHRIGSIFDRGKVESVLGENYIKSGVILANAMATRLIEQGIIKHEDVSS